MVRFKQFRTSLFELLIPKVSVRGHVVLSFGVYGGSCTVTEEYNKDKLSPDYIEAERKKKGLRQ